MLLPISTDTSIRRTPWANYGLIAACVVVHVLYILAAGSHQRGSSLAGTILHLRELGVLQGSAPHLYEFITYQFLHANFAHIAGNMLFLWIFGNPVNAKMGHLPYVLFYLAGGVFAATVYGMNHEHALVGASGAIAAITTAYLALFPRSHVTVLYWWFLIGTFELPSMWMIGFKLILWDNILTPKMMPLEGRIAFDAHLAGYAFGFAVTAAMLALRALPRDQFDIIALWHRWIQRRSFKTVMGAPEAQARARFGRVARPVSVDTVKLADEPAEPTDPIAKLRQEITRSFSHNDWDTAATLYEKILDIDPRQVLARKQQLDVANQLYTLQHLPQAAAAYEKYLSNYADSAETVHVRLLLGIIYARDLQQYEVAEGHLTLSLAGLSDDKRREQCRHWLNICNKHLGRSTPGDNP